MARRPNDRRPLTYLALGLAPALVVSAVGIGAVIAHRSISASVALSAGSQITLVGHGLGHGRGMGQYGAFGYAKKGWTSDQILGHYYGGTTAGKIGNQTVSVALTRHPSVTVYADAGMTVGGQSVAPGQAVRLSGSTATITAGCGGAVVRSLTANPPVVAPINTGSGRPANELLKFCGTNDAYRGSMTTNGARAVNVVNLDDYVKGVTPKESPARWADQGGAEALKAQAVAARTYVLAATAKGKKIDDTMNSQVYGGVAGEDPRTNAAADATAGVIRTINGQPAFTEFSSSTGGYTAGVNFPAVIDEGDTESPNHDWTATVGAGSIASAFGVGSLKSIAVIEANGLGANSGRATKVRIVGTSRTVEATGDDVRSKLQLKSAWFTVQGQPAPRIVAPPAGVGPGTPSGAASTPGGILPSLVDSLLGAIGGGGTPSTPAAPSTPTTPSTTAPSTTVPGEGAIPGTLTGPLADLLKAAITAIDGKIAELGGPSGVLGQVLGPVITIVGGFVQKFANGNVYFSPTTGAHALTGTALSDFVAKGAEGALGLPKADAIVPPAP